MFFPLLGIGLVSDKGTTRRGRVIDEQNGRRGEENEGQINDSGSPILCTL